MHIVRLLNHLGYSHLKWGKPNPHHSPLPTQMRVERWASCGTCLNKLSSVELMQLRTIKVTFSSAGSIRFRLLVLHQIACGWLWLRGWWRPWWRERDRNKNAYATGCNIWAWLFRRSQWGLCRIRDEEGESGDSRALQEPLYLSEVHKGCAVQ